MGEEEFLGRNPGLKVAVDGDGDGDGDGGGGNGGGGGDGDGDGDGEMEEEKDVEGMKVVGPHELMIARLNDEKVVREELERKRKELVVKKGELVMENKKRKEELAGLDELLRKFIESSRAIQSGFGKEM